MSPFEEALNRLKAALKVTEDQEVAELLGFTKAAFSARKTRGRFPEKELYALAARRPELRLDVRDVMTGYKQREALAKLAGAMPMAAMHGALATMHVGVGDAAKAPPTLGEEPAQYRALSEQAQQLLKAWHACDEADRAAIAHLARRLAADPTKET